MSENDVKQQVREFYDSVGWKHIGEDLYQNARYEDLRRVSQAYIHRCHVRVGRYLQPRGKYLLDAGSGPIQYPEYLHYSDGYQYRVCLDISILALREAKQRLGEHGLCVVADIANMPFKDGVFDSVVSLHTVHHLPADEHAHAFEEMHRVLASNGKAAVVYNWGGKSPLRRRIRGLVKFAMRVQRGLTNRLGWADPKEIPQEKLSPDADALLRQPGTVSNKWDYAWITAHPGKLPGFDLRVWRTVSPGVMRALIHPWLLGRFWLWLLYGLEEVAPRYFGRIGQYPIILFRKPGNGSGDERSAR